MRFLQACKDVLIIAKKHKSTTNGAKTPLVSVFRPNPDVLTLAPAFRQVFVAHGCHYLNETLNVTAAVLKILNDVSC